MPQDEFDIPGREFGSAPCPRKWEIEGCPGNDCCEEGDLCLLVAEHEWPAQMAAIEYLKGIFKR